MIRLLPFILIPVLILAGLGYWRYVSTRSNPSLPQAVSDLSPIEVPKTLPQESIEDRVKSLEDLASKMVVQINALKSTASSASSADSTKINTLDSSVTELKARVSVLEKTTPAPSTSSSTSKFSVYIPLGSGGGSWQNQDWYTTSEYLVSLDPANYPGYSGMVLEVIFRLSESTGTAYVRLYNSTDSSAVSSSDVSTTSSAYTLQTSSSFKLASGTKTYKLQVKNTDGKDLYIQTARIKVSF